MRLASWDSWLLLLVRLMLGKSCSSLRDGGGGVCEDLVVRVFETRLGGGVLGSGVKASGISSVDMYLLCSSEQGTTDMEMERPWLAVGCRGWEGLQTLERGLMGEKASLSCDGSEPQEPVSPVSSTLPRQERAAARRGLSSEFELRRLMVSSQLDACSTPSRFPAAAF